MAAIETLPAENPEHGLRNGCAARAPLDSAPRRNIMGRIVKAGETRALWNGARQYHSVAHGGAPQRRGQRAIKTWGGSGRPGSEALPAEYRGISLQLGHDARASLDIAVRRNNAGLAAANRTSRATRAQRPCCDMVRSEIATSHPATPYDVAGGGRARRGAIAAGLGNKALPVRPATTICVLVRGTIIFGHRGVA